MDKSDHFEYICCNYQTVCDSDAFRKLAEPFENVVKSFDSGPGGKPRFPVKFVHGRLERIEAAKNQIVISK